MRLVYNTDWGPTYEEVTEASDVLNDNYFVRCNALLTILQATLRST